MIEYELSVNIKVENKEALDNLLVTVESLQSGEIEATAIELLSIKGLCLNTEKPDSVAEHYEQDSWLSPLSVKTISSA